MDNKPLKTFEEGLREFRNLPCSVPRDKHRGVKGFYIEMAYEADRNFAGHPIYFNKNEAEAALEKIKEASSHKDNPRINKQTIYFDKDFNRFSRNEGKW